MQRRYFLKSGAVALVTMGLSPTFLRRTAFGMTVPGTPKGKVLICLFQRGAADGLNMIVPFGDRAYHRLRPDIAIPEPIRGAGTAAGIDLDGFFALHPSLSPFKPLWDRGVLAPIQAVGSPSATRSHFDAQDFLESGTPDTKGTADGWLNRYLATSGTCEACVPSPFRAVALAPQTPRILEGRAPAVAMNSLEEFSVRGGDVATSRLEALWGSGPSDLIHGTGQEMLEAVKMLRSANPRQYQPAREANYPPSLFGQRVRQIAQLIKAGVGLEVAFADIGGWDTHVNQGGVQGQLAQRLDDFAQSIAALVADLGDRMNDVIILTMSEFGRMARQNGNGGTDHGHAGAMFAIGGPIKGGRVYGRWPGLEPDQLFEGRDLALTTDFRTVFSEIAAGHLGATQLGALFPGFTESRSLRLLG